MIVSSRPQKAHQPTDKKGSDKMPTTKTAAKKAAAKQPTKAAVAVNAEPSEIEQMRRRLQELEAAQAKTPEQKLIERLERENADLRGQVEIGKAGFYLETPEWPPQENGFAEPPEILEVADDGLSDTERIHELQSRVAKLEAAIEVFLSMHNTGR
jgi:hypothetical protein